MHRIAILTAVCLLALFHLAAAPAVPVVTTGSLLEEMIDLGRLARWPEPAYRTVQFSSSS